MSLIATCLGYPGFGAGRDLEKALEAFWAKNIPQEALTETARALRSHHWSGMKAAGIDHVPCNDLSFYDQVLDTAVMLGAIPAGYLTISDPLTRLFALARGLQDPERGVDLRGLGMTRWFDTNYHHIVPELSADQTFQLDPTKILGEVEEACALGIEPRPVILGPVSFLLLSRLPAGADASATTLRLLDRLLLTYQELLVRLAGRVSWVQIDEPCLVLDLDGHARECYRRAFDRLTFSTKRPQLLLATYLRANLGLVTSLGCEALHVDLVRAPEQLDALLAGIGPETTLSLGVVDDRSTGHTDLDCALELVRRAVGILGPNRVWVGPSGSLLHVPADPASEERLAPEGEAWQAFAAQKLEEIRMLADVGDASAPSHPSLSGPRFEAARAAAATRRTNMGEAARLTPRTHLEG